MDARTLGPADFDGKIGQPVIVTIDDGSAIGMTLDSTSLIDPRAPEPTGADDPVAMFRKQPFTLALKGPLAPVLEGQTYVVTLPDQEPLWLFLSPYHQDGSATYYEIVFN